MIYPPDIFLLLFSLVISIPNPSISFNLLVLNAIELGYSIVLVAKRIDDTVPVVMRTYAHLYPNKQQELVSKLEAIGSPTSNNDDSDSMSRPVLWCHDVKKAPESFDFSLLSGAFKLFFDNKPCYHFPAHPASAFCRRWCQSDVILPKFIVFQS